MIDTQRSRAGVRPLLFKRRGQPLVGNARNAGEKHVDFVHQSLTTITSKQAIASSSSREAFNAMLSSISAISLETAAASLSHKSRRILFHARALESSTAVPSELLRDRYGAK